MIAVSSGADQWLRDQSRLPVSIHRLRDELRIRHVFVWSTLLKFLPCAVGTGILTSPVGG